MAHYPNFDHPAQSILAGFGLPENSPFIQNSAALQAQKRANSSSLILERVEAHRRQTQAAEDRQTALQALITHLGRE